MMKKIFLIAGEQSGDVHGSHLVRSLKQQNPHFIFEGVAGGFMRAAGVHAVVQSEELEVMGFTDVFCSLGKLVKLFYTIRNAILQKQPDAVILIDYPGFNLRMAKSLRKKGFKGKIIQYISPSVWAWGKKRIPQMAKNLDLLLSIYPFEQELYANSSLPVEFIGNPLQQYILEHPYVDDWQQHIHLPKSTRLIAIFPGSRKGEIERNLPLLLQAASIYKKDYPDAIFGISCAHPAVIEQLKGITEPLSVKLGEDLFFVPKSFTYELMRDCRTAIAKSGTVTLELAFHQRPTLVMYQTSFINRFIAEYVLRLSLPYFCIVNILSDKEVFPELIEEKPTIDNIITNLNQIDNEGPFRDSCIEACKQLNEKFGNTLASTKAAEAICRLLA